MTAVLAQPPYHGSYIREDYPRHLDDGQKAPGDVQMVCFLPEEVALAMVQLVYPGTTLENYLNKAFTVVGYRAYSLAYVCVYKHDDYWYLCWLAVGAYNAHNQRTGRRDTVPEELPEY